MIKDRYNRIHDYLRISLTDNCNLRCFYCMPEESYEFTPASRLMQVEEILELARLFVSMGVNKIRLTGGEPLVRKDAAAIMAGIGKLPVKQTITTNGVRAHEFIDTFRNAGIKSVNISLDTLNAERFTMMTRRNHFSIVKRNIESLIDHGFHVKVNTVVIKGINENELKDFVGWTRERPIHVRFIEFMPFSGNRWQHEKVFTWQEMLHDIAAVYSFEKLGDALNDTDKKYQVPGYAGTFAIISTMSAPFCSTCNRMRLTADGKMKNCLFSKEETDLLSVLRMGGDVRPLIHSSIASKAMELGGQFTTDYEHLDAASLENRSMITIGG
jgi:cyclic pyranopterin phosphate synthase